MFLFIQQTFVVEFRMHSLPYIIHNTWMNIPENVVSNVYKRYDVLKYTMTSPAPTH